MAGIEDLIPGKIDKQLLQPGIVPDDHVCAGCSRYFIDDGQQFIYTGHVQTLVVVDAAGRQAGAVADEQGGLVGTDCRRAGDVIRQQVVFGEPSADTRAVVAAPC